MQTLLCSHVIVCNGSGAKTNVWICIVPPGVTPDPTNAILWSFGILTDDKLEFFVGGIINTSEQVWAKADTPNVISLRISGDMSGAGL